MLRPIRTLTFKAVEIRVLRRKAVLAGWRKAEWPQFAKQLLMRAAIEIKR